MLTLMPRSGLGSVMRRRNSKSYDTSRRDSFSVFSTNSLPSSPDNLRRFSSYEELGPLVQQMLGTPQQQPETRLKGRRASITRLIRKNSLGRRDSEEKKMNASMDALDMQLARVREQLAQMRSQGQDMSQRVEDLSNSVQSLVSNQQSTPTTPIPHSASARSLRVIRESLLETEIVGEISEDSEISESDEEQSFEEYCRNTIPLLGDRRVSNSNATCPLSPTVEIIIGCAEEDPKQCSILNNAPMVFAQKSHSRLEHVQNDLGTNTCEETNVQSNPLFITRHHSHTLTPVH